MPVCRVIFRIDYKANYDIIDSPGRLLRIVSSAPDKYWSSLGENTAQHQVQGSYIAPDRTLYRQLTIAPTNLIIAIEASNGMSLRALDKEEAFSTPMGLASQVVEAFGIQDVIRMGFRIFYFSDLGAGFAGIKAAFAQIVNERCNKLIEEQLGPIDDIGLMFDGHSPDKVAYHLRAGPFEPTEQEIAKYVEQIDGAEFVKRSKFDFVCDLDLYDTNFSLAKLPPLKWCRQLTTRQAAIISGLEDMLRQPQKS